MKRKVEVVIISDVHLGTYGCRAKELHRYLNSIDPAILILNGDIIDIWQFKKRYFPKSHQKILKKLIQFSMNGTEVVYITGNHDEMLRKFTNLEMGNFKLTNKKVLELNGKRTWIFHGDVFDASVQHSKWIAKLGGVGYDLLIQINTVSNWILNKLGREKYSLSKKIKNSVKKAVKYISDFEDTASELAIENGYDYVICGHIHQPQIRKVENKKGSTIYMNSGDWIENLTSLEYNDQQWTIFNFEKDHEDMEENEESEMFMMSLEQLIFEVTQKNLS